MTTDGCAASVCGSDKVTCCAAAGLTISNDKDKMEALVTRCMDGTYRAPLLLSTLLFEALSGYWRVEGLAEEVDQQPDAFGKLPGGIHQVDRRGREDPFGEDADQASCFLALCNVELWH